MKKCLSFLLAIVMVLSILTGVPLTVNAASVSDLTFELNDDGESYSVTDCNYGASGALEIPGTYNGKPVTNIGGYAFENCDSLTSVIIPDSVTNIGLGAFEGCESLISVYITDIAKWCNIKFDDYSSNPLLYAQNLYLNGEEVTDLVIPNGVTSIGDFAFYSCENLTSIIIPDNVTSIGYYAFEGCTNLESITISDSVMSIGFYAFFNTNYYNNTNNWKNDVLYINNHLISAKMNLTGDYEIKDGTKCIAVYAFEQCIGIEEITLPDSVTSIDEGAFIYCDSLKSVIIPNSVTNIERRAFYSCTSLKSITIPSSVKNIGEQAFGYYMWGGTKKVTEFTIYGKKDTAAEIYAKENDFAFVNICEHKSTKWITDKKATVNSAGSKHKECTVCGETLETAEIAQLKPGRTTVKATTTSTGVKISWSKVTGADKYTVYRKTGDGSYKAIKTVTGTSYTDTTVKSGTKYKYNVKARNEAGYGEYAKSGVTKLFLATPKVTVANASSGVTVKWNKITGAKGYYVYRKASGAKSWTKIATVKSGTTVSYTDKKASAGKKYYYTVKAYNGDYVSTTKASAIIERLKAPTIKSVTSGKSGVTVKWAKATGADGYYVYRKTGSGSYTKIATVKGNTKVSYLDKSAKKGKTYTYYVKAYSGKSVSTSSKTLKIKDKY